MQEFTSRGVPVTNVHITFGGVSPKYVGVQDDDTSCGVRVVRAIESILFYDEVAAIKREQDTILAARWTFGALVLLRIVLSALMPSGDGTLPTVPRTRILHPLTVFLDSQARSPMCVRASMAARLVSLSPVLRVTVRTFRGQEARGCRFVIFASHVADATSTARPELLVQET